MKQLLQNLRNGETIVADVPIPNPSPGTALVRTAASLVSVGTERMLVEFAEKSLLGKARSRPDLLRQVLDKARREGLLTTMEAAFNRLDQPIPLGYSSSGTIVALAEGMQGFQVGQRVACAGGGYAAHAEYAVVPRNLLALLPDNVDFEAGACATLGAIALHGFRLTGVQLGERLAVVGLGLLGLLSVGIARAAGCHVLGIDTDPQRVELAQSLGAKAVVRDQAEAAAQSFSRGRGCDAVLICAATHSSDPVELAGLIARDRAHVVAAGAVGLQIPRKTYFEKEISFINSRSYGPGRYDPAYEQAGHDYPIGYVRWTEGRNLEAFVDLLESGRLDVHPLITHRFSIDQAPAAYALITGKRQEPFLGVLLTYGADREVQEASQDRVGKFEESLPAAPFSISQPEAIGATLSTDTCKLGVLGAGNFAGAVLLPAVSKLPKVELVGIASASGVSARHAAAKFGFRYATADETQVIHDPGVNTVAILTRHNLHARQVLAALAAGKHVFCEKPLAIRPDELAEIAQALNLHLLSLNHSPPPAAPLLMVGFNRRFAPLSRRLKEFVQEAAEPLVAHYRVNAGYLPPAHWLHDPEIGGGRLIGEGCHFVDFLAFLVGAPPLSVAAESLPDGGLYREDNAVLNFTFPDGSLGTVSYLANGDQSFPKERVEVFAGGRIGVLEDFRSLEMVCKGRRRSLRSRFRQDKGHRAEWEALCEAITSNGSPPIPYDHIFGVTQATFAAVQALRCGETTFVDSLAPL